MAKQLVNPIERHVEKGILGLSVLLLIAAVAMFLVTTPNQFELEGTNVTPGNRAPLLRHSLTARPQRRASFFGSKFAIRL